MESNISYTDLEISAGFCRGERWAFEAAARNYFAPVVNFTANLIHDRDRAVDLSQEAFFLACRAHGKVDPCRPLGPWLFQIARNLAYKDFNKRKKQMNVSLDQILEDADLEIKTSDPNPRRESLRKEIQVKVRGLVDRLSPKYRDIVTLRMIQGLSSDSVAELLQLPVSTVNTRIHRALKTLRKYARQEGLTEEELFS